MRLSSALRPSQPMGNQMSLSFKQTEPLNLKRQTGVPVCSFSTRYAESGP